MTRLIIGRVLQVVPVLFAVSFVTFWVLSVLPGDQSILLLGTQVPPEMQVQIRQELHLDDPLLVRYGLWLSDMLHGDFGFSWRYSEDVGPLLWQAWKNTALLAGAAAAFSLTLGVGVGALAGAFRGRWPDRLVTSTAIAALSAPQFWVAILMVRLFAVQLGWFPSSGLPQDGDGVLGYLKHLAMPVVALALIAVAITARVTRVSVIEAYEADSVDLLRAKGLRERQVFRHVMKNALSPILTSSGLQVGYLLGGAVLIELIFVWPGLGSMLYRAITERDFVIVQAVVLVTTVTFVLVNLVVDILQMIVDPRVVSK